MANLSDGARRILQRCKELGFANPGEAIQGKSYVSLFDSLEDAKVARAELISAGLCENNDRGSVKLTEAGATEAKAT